ncbi:MAG TPA: hypothetical protein EYH34_12460, partial [Planctomycetes bacterium]|nr:hypothetical protein [Planctomycetota bacterium]
MPSRSLALAAFSALTLCQPFWAAAAEVTLSLEQAVAEGKIDLEIRSLGRPSGACMKLVIKRRVPETLRLTVRSGLVFKSRSGKVQDMVAAKVLGEYNAKKNTYRPDGLMILADDATHSFVLEAYCLEADKPTPGLREGFLLGGFDLQARGILELGFSRKASRHDLQMALWMRRPLAPGLTVERLMGRIQATGANVKAGRSILAQLEVDGLARWIGPFRFSFEAQGTAGGPAAPGTP